MPVETHYVDMGNGAYKHAYGVLTSTDLLVAGLIQAQDVENTRRLKYMLYDFTDVAELRMGHEIVAQLVELCRTTASHSQGLLAALVAPNDLLFGMARNWQTLTADLGWKVQVFRQREEAIAWLRRNLSLQNVTSAFLEDFPALRPQTK